MTQNETSNDTTTEASQAVECRMKKEPPVRYWFLPAAMSLGFGIWCIMDLKSYPYTPYSEDLNKWVGWLFNHGGAIALPILGVLLALGGLMVLRKRLRADAEGIGWVGKEKIRWEDIEEVDAKELKSKGIARIHYGDEETLTLDNWKLTNFRELMALVDEKIPAEKMKT